VSAILAGYKSSGLSRREYCEREGLTLPMLDYYHRRIHELRHRQEREKANPAERPRAGQKLLRVEVAGESSAPRPSGVTPVSTPATEHEIPGFAVELAGGRRIESNWSFREQDLIRLIRTVEVA